ncbi:hypothetical protein CAPTEDRAFT_191288 [Capitella teleta]|uniref:Thrombospondin type-1 domain-containing protein n=1 Tax=Capitella teleta TaxID=283909 RepID=R7U678_CAPTE|nr:hypothetical protein CAPTEDRAFT_191288 [Capitella teleta]|eukprot:ELU01865.1 hypothetical protein CAPTEDRAFT_191288 [Capitella teleta]
MEWRSSVSTRACKPEDRPKTTKLCRPRCKAEHSYCMDVNHCSCERGFTEKWSDNHDTLLSCTRMTITHNRTDSTIDADSENQALYYQEDGRSNFWMYAVIAAGSAFIIFVGIALYTVWKTREDRSPRNVSSATTSVGQQQNAVGKHQSEVALMNRRENNYPTTQIDIS